jgi:enoyl-CoA hydratase/carnithine racemase
MREVDVTIDGGIAFVTIDRPQAQNAIGLRTIDELGAVLDEVLAGAAAVVVLRGAGERAFAKLWLSEAHWSAARRLEEGRRGASSA